MADISQRVQRMVAVLDDGKTAIEAARLMSEKHIGSVVVTTGSKVKGLFTERDLMRAVAAGSNAAEIRLKDVMRTEIPTVSPRESVERCLALMGDNHSRHLLVYDGSEFVGLVSLRDLVMLMLDEKERLIQELTRYITT
jgi:CBS domain-containing protein